MTEIINNQEINYGPSLHVENIKFDYYYHDKEYLLRYRPIIKDNIKYIQFDSLNRKIISNEKKMYTCTFEAKDFIDEDSSFNKNLDIYTYLTLSFEKNPPKFKYTGDNKELILTIKNNKEDPYDYTLSETICEDDDFWNKNIELKIKILEDKFKSKEMEFKNMNEKLKNDIQEKSQQLKQIRENNEKLGILNERITKSLSELEEKQKKAIEQLNQVS